MSKINGEVGYNLEVFPIQNPSSKVLAMVNLKFYVNGKDFFVISGMKIIQGNDKFLAMPNYKKADGEYKDIAFPLMKSFRESINKVALEIYHEKISSDNSINVSDDIIPF